MVSACGFGVFSFIAYPKFIVKHRNKYVRNLYKDKGIFVRTNLEIKEDGLLQETETASVLSKFSRIKSIEEISQYIFIMLGDIAYVIPRNKIEEGNIDLFVENLQKKLNSRLP